jgi:Ca2+-binding EF-hand superfamily protein
VEGAPPTQKQAAATNKEGRIVMTMGDTQNELSAEQIYEFKEAFALFD